MNQIEDAIIVPQDTTSMSNNGAPSIVAPSDGDLHAILDDAHFDRLTRTIAPSIIRQRGSRSLRRTPEDRKLLDDLGFLPVQVRLPALLIKRTGTDGRELPPILRPDDPRKRSNGKPAKYEAAFGSHNALDVPKHCQPMLGNPGVRRVIAEGPIKTDVVATLAPDVVALGINGVWGWLGTNDQNGKVALPDWRDIALNGSEVWLEFDRDTLTKVAVRKAATQLRDFLISKGATVKFLDWSKLDQIRGGESFDDTVKDIEDLVALGMTRDEWEAMHSAELEVIQEELVEVADPKDLRGTIMRILSGEGAPFQKNRKIADQTIRHMCERGEFLQTRDGEYFYFSKVTHTLSNIESGSFKRALASRTDLATTEAEFVFLLDKLKTRGSEQEPVQVHTLGHYDKASGHLSVSFGNSTVFYYIDGTWEAGWNGANGFIFRTDERAVDIEPDLKSEGALKWLRDQMLFDGSGTLSRDEQWSLTMIWLLSQFIPPLTRTILLALGEKGTGKTSFLRALGRVIIGSDFRVSAISKDKEDGLITGLSNSLILAIDNADSRIDYLEDLLAVYATGIGVPRRKYYTTNDQVMIYLRAGLMMSSRDAHFKREDVADRVIPTHFAAPKSRIDEDTMLADLMAHRAGILGELLVLLGKIADAMKTKQAPRGSFRMADFMRLGWFYFDVVEPDKNNRIFELLAKLEAAQAEFAIEEDSLTTVLRLLLWDHKAGASNIGNISQIVSGMGGIGTGTLGPVLTGDLYRVYRLIADAESLPVLQSSVSFGKKLAANQRNLELQLNATITFKASHAGGRVITIVAKPNLGGGGDV